MAGDAGRRSKLMTAREAVSRFIEDGDSIYTGYTQVPMSLTHEIIRQGKRGLEVIGASVGGQATLLILAGCCNRVTSGYIGGALRPGPVQDLMQRGALRYDDYSNGAIAMMLMAGAFGLPFVPMKWFLGTDYLRPEFEGHAGAVRGQRKWKRITSPFDGQEYLALPALRPDVTIMHFQRADELGNVQAWGAFGDAKWALWAARKVIISVEEIVPTSAIRTDPNRTIVPAARVAAVVHEPWGAHPTSVPGYYDYDYDFFRATAGSTASVEGFRAFAEEWIYGLPDRAAYVDHIEKTFGAGWLERVRVRQPILPERTVDYGFAPVTEWHETRTNR